MSALKLVRVEMTESTAHCAEAKRRLLNEARVVSALKHPHIRRIQDAGESDGLPYLCWSFAKEESAGRPWRKSGRCGPNTVAARGRGRWRTRTTGTSFIAM